MKIATQWNVHKLYAEAALFGPMASIPAAFLPVFALRLGAPNAAIGFLTALPALINVFWLIPAARLIEPQRTLRAPLMVASLLTGLQFLAIAAVPALPAPWQMPAILGVVALGAMPGGLYGVLINTVLAGTLASGERVRVLGNRSMLFTAAEALSILLGGWFLGLFNLPLNYQLLFCAVGAVAIVNVAVLRTFAVPRTATGATAAASASAALRQLRRIFDRHGPARPFLGFLLAALVILFGGWLPRALFSVYWVRVLNASDWWVGLINGSYSVAAVLAYPLWTRLARRWSGRKLLIIGAFGFALYPVLTVAAPSTPYLLIPALSGGFLSPPYSLGLLSSLFDFAPESNRPTYMAMYTAAANLSAFVAPILSTSVLLPLIGIQASLLLGAGVRFLGGVFVFLLVKKPAST